MKLEKAYQVLNVRRGASVREIKEAHRKLVKNWHPDRFQEESEISHATRKISEINRAYVYLMKIKRLTGKTSVKSSASSSERSVKPSGRKATTSSNSSGRKSTDERTVSNDDASISGFDKWSSRFTNKQHSRDLDRKARNFKSRDPSKLRQVERKYEKRAQSFYSATSLGFYKSWINRLLLKPTIKAGSSGTGLGSYQHSHKYEAILNYEQIKDLVFYAVNSHVNVILKYGFGVFLLMQACLIIMQNFWQGIPVFGLEPFIWAELKVLVAFLVILIPDAVIRRLVLWQTHDLPIRRARKVFKNGRLPGIWNRIYWAVLTLKFSFVTLLFI